MRDAADSESVPRRVGARALNLLADVWLSLRRRPLPAVLPVLILALGIGGAVSLFGVVKATQIDPLPFAQPQQLLHLAYADPVEPRDRQPLFAGDIKALGELDDHLAASGAYVRTSATLAEGEQGERFDAARITPGLFRLLGVAPLLGREFSETDLAGGAAVILSHALWQQRYGGDPAIVGRVLRAAGNQAVVVGVMPPDFAFPFTQRFWLPLDLAAAEDYTGAGRADVIVRLRGGVGLEQFEHAVQPHYADWVRRAPEAHRGLELRAMPLDRMFVDWQFRGIVNLLFVAIGGLLLIACANAAGILLADTLGRMPEQSLRAALGASRARLAGAALVRGLAIVVLAAGSGLLFARAALDWSLATLRAGEDPVPYWLRFDLDGGVLGFAALGALLALLIAGWIPALHARGALARDALRAGMRASAPRGLLRVLRGLMGVQVALAVAAVVVGMMIGRAFLGMLAMDLGAQGPDVLTARVALPGPAYADADARLRFMQQVRERLGEAAEVHAVGLTTDLPGFSGAWVRIAESADPDRAWSNARGAAVDPGFFDTLRVRLREGRPFDARDRAESARVAIVDEVFAARWPHGQVLGREILVDIGQAGPVAHRVVGVVAPLHLAQVDDPRGPAMLLALAQDPPSRVSIAVRVAGEPSAFAPALARVLRGIDPGLTPYLVRSFDETVAYGRSSANFMIAWFVAVAALAMLLTACGLYGVITLCVGLDTRAIGIRRALGGGASRVLGAVLRPIVLSLGLGFAIGWAVAVPLGRGAAALSPHLLAFDAATVALALGVLLLAALLAALAPALRALRVDPIEALRYE